MGHTPLKPCPLCGREPELIEHEDLERAATGRVVTYVVGTDPVTQLIGYAESAAGAAGTAIDVRWVI